MSRQQLAPGAHGLISVAANPRASGSVLMRDAFYAQCRFHDPATGKTVLLRRFAPSEDAARQRLQDAIAERTHPDAPDPRFATLGDAVAAYSAGSEAAAWSEGTARSYRYAMERLSEHGAEPWPVNASRADELFGDGSRTGELALRLLRKVRRG